MSEQIASFPNAKAFRFCSRPCASILAFLLSRTSAKTIFFSASAYSRVRGRVIESLKKTGIRIVVTHDTPGRKRGSKEQAFRLAKKLVKKGRSVAHACKKAAIPRRTYYYLLKIEKGRLKI